MATHKSYTDLEQSKKLAEILPLESADMYYSPNAINTEGQVLSYNPFPKCIETIQFNDGKEIFAWSLAALLGVLPNYQLQTQDDGIGVLVLCSCDGKFNIVTADTPVDACYEMILKLHELNLL